MRGRPWTGDLQRINNSVPSRGQEVNEGDGRAKDEGEKNEAEGQNGGSGSDDLKAGGKGQ